MSSIKVTEAMTDKFLRLDIAIGTFRPRSDAQQVYMAVLNYRGIQLVTQQTTGKEKGPCQVHERYRGKRAKTASGREKKQPIK
jgi:hypothetical protein